MARKFSHTQTRIRRPSFMRRLMAASMNPGFKFSNVKFNKVQFSNVKFSKVKFNNVSFRRVRGTNFRQLG